MRVRVLFFGMLKDFVGKSSDVLELPDGGLVRDVLSHYISDFPRMRESMASLAGAGDQGYAGPGTALQADDEVALVPPAHGGSGGSAGGARSGQHTGRPR